MTWPDVLTLDCNGDRRRNGITVQITLSFMTPITHILVQGKTSLHSPQDHSAQTCRLPFKHIFL